MDLAVFIQRLPTFFFIFKTLGVIDVRCLAFPNVYYTSMLFLTYLA